MQIAKRKSKTRWFRPGSAKNVLIRVSFRHKNLSFEFNPIEFLYFILSKSSIKPKVPKLIEIKYLYKDFGSILTDIIRKIL